MESGRNWVSILDSELVNPHLLWQGEGLPSDLSCWTDSLADVYPGWDSFLPLLPLPARAYSYCQTAG